jgi:hypothetical protein
MTDVRWSVPQSWEWASIREVAEVVGGGTPDTKDDSNFTDDGIPWLTPADLTGYKATYISRGARDLSEKGYKKSSAKLMPPGSVLFSSRAPIGYCVIASNEICTNQGFKSFVLRHELSPEYLRYYLIASVDYARSKASGTTFQELSGSRAAELAVPIAPIPAQHRIVAKIESVFAKSKRARDNLDHIPRLVEKYKQAILSAAFRGELTRKWRQGSEQSAAQTLSKVRSDRRSTELSPRRRAALSNLPRRPSQLPKLPTTWVWACIEELAAADNRAIQSGPFGSNLLHSEFQETGYLVIGIDNVQDGIFSLGSQNRIGETKFFELERFRARPQDVLVTVMATIGRTCVLPDQVEPAAAMTSGCQISRQAKRC